MTEKVKTQLTSIVGASRRFLASDLFFWGVVGWFFVQALWIAASAGYPLVYDEFHHFFLIETYAKQLSPFIASQEASTAVLGDITRTVSYLYHYLMSFPYRIIDGLLESQTQKIVILRAINVVFVGLGIIIYRKIFDELKISKVHRNLALFIAIMIPAFTFVAAHINYDNLLFLLSGLVLLMLVRLVKSPSASQIIVLTSLLIAGSLVKKTYLLIATFVFIFLAIAIYRYGKERFVRAILSTWRSYVLFKKIILILLLSGMVFLGVERIGLNLIQHKAVEPKCFSIHAPEFCLTNPVISRDTKLEEAANNNPNRIAISEYGGFWADGIMDSLFGELDNNRGAKLEAKEPLQPLNFIAWFMLIAGTILLIRYFPNINRRLSPHNYLMYIPLIYLLSTFAFLYTTYLKLGAPVAIQGRYQLLFMPLLVLLIILAFSFLRLDRRIKGVLVAILILLFLQGGLTSYILSSDQTWNWDSERVRTINNQSRDVLEVIY